MLWLDIGALKFSSWESMPDHQELNFHGSYLVGLVTDFLVSTSGVMDFPSTEALSMISCEYNKQSR
jgi:hypothetical protein